jgi:homoserine kinase type II
VRRLERTGGFSGALLWRVESQRGPLCLRRWPHGHPSSERLEFIQAVLWHVDQEEFHLIPVPLETHHRHGYVLFDGHLWELTPWLPGRADYRQQPGPAKLQAALIALASFHQAAASFPLPETGPAISPGIDERRRRLAGLAAGRLDDLRRANRQSGWLELANRGERLIDLAVRLAPRVASALDSAASVRVPLSPCIRDIWSAHILFENDQVSGIVDFGSMRAENVAADVARLLGSMAGDDAQAWRQGLAAYQAIRPLSDEELLLLSVFDRSTVLMGGLQWLEWIYLDRRTFADRAAVLSRIDEFLARLTTFSDQSHVR